MAPEENWKQQCPFMNKCLELRNTTKTHFWFKLSICLLISLKLVTLMTLMLYYSYKGDAQFQAVKYKMANHIKCPATDINYGRNVSSLTESNTTIFFVETSKRTNPTFLTMCSVESAARSHPTTKVVFFMKGLTARSSTQALGISLLNCFPNVEIKPIDLNEIFADTPLSFWYSQLNPWWQPYLITTIADATRLAIMWKYGGIYLDTDIIVLKNLLNLTNSIGREQRYLVNTAFLAFNQHHDFIGRCLKDFVEHFNGWIWGHQGPQLVTRVLKKWCRTNSVTKIQQCKGVKMLSPEAFYPIRWQDWKKYFEVVSKSEAQELLKNSYAVHIWNKKSHGTGFRTGSKVMIDQLSSVYCPLSYKIMSWQENV
ncbi:lactosylceramide 4-alpha-galactosyltransferase-like isoform X2 [Pristis pectinata]|nr:lactosylceramide 4-alpha-galactosyltransferase-like isoform X2 [Pristis pectinata]XP_051885931.1 lactosylceramide 4-alpha-galactosyltransferase-like isoform X2 [Pristis pectinata]XP_051885932.1 lactosylceramide 4-alpha-galactosyltransferase-like isoform X2 [Pristis pectinata]XP_051885933.1 lactosylceramide 4-alpha-galactosyltransferase-like isoform X2 [Pristis pectinata]